MRAFLLTLALALTSPTIYAAPQDAERFTHIAGINLADLPSFEDLAKIFGSSHISHTGDAADSDSRVCYRTVDGNAAIEFFRGEVDWGFLLRVAHPSDRRCPISKANVSAGLVIAGVSLQMSRAAYMKVTGKPSEDDANQVKHKFQYVHVLTDTELSEQVQRGISNGYPLSDPEDWRRWDVVISLTAKFTKGRLSSFTVYRVETN